jgi:glutamate-1-semialdehyde 2,1-aminomutase
MLPRPCRFLAGEGRFRTGDVGLADSAGVPPEFAATTISLPFNSLLQVEQAFAERGSDIAAIIVEPVAGNMGCIPPEPGFLEGLRALCTKTQSAADFR